MKTHWKLSENAWEYWGDIYITSKEMPTVKKTDSLDYEMNVDGVIINFDEEIRYAGVIGDQTEKGGVQE